MKQLIGCFIILLSYTKLHSQVTKMDTLNIKNIVKGINLTKCEYFFICDTITSELPFKEDNLNFYFDAKEFKVVRSLLAKKPITFNASKVNGQMQSIEYSSFEKLPYQRSIKFTNSELVALNEMDSLVSLSVNSQSKKKYYKNIHKLSETKNYKSAFTKRLNSKKYLLVMFPMLTNETHTLYSYMIYSRFADSQFYYKLINKK